MTKCVIGNFVNEIEDKVRSIVAAESKMEGPYIGILLKCSIKK